MPKEIDLVKLNTLKRYIRDIKKMRVSSTSVNDLRIQGNKILKDIITLATTKARKNKRDTIMPRDTDPSIAKILGKQGLEATDIFKEIKKLKPLELGKLSKLINDHIQTQKEKQR